MDIKEKSLKIIICCKMILLFFFFFQAEDGIRDGTVTGVQTCALPIYVLRAKKMSVSSPVWLEVALNGPWTRAIQPRAPFSVAQIIEEGVACAGEGAAIVHAHAYDERGQPTEDADIYTRIIEGIRARCDAIVYPTIAFTPEDPDSPQRLAPLRELSRRGLLEWLPIDPGSININRYEAVA